MLPVVIAHFFLKEITQLGYFSSLLFTFHVEVTFKTKAVNSKGKNAHLAAGKKFTAKPWNWHLSPSRDLIAQQSPI